MGEAVIPKEKSPEGAHDAYRKLLKELEGARTRLAVAIAEETKATPLQRWNYYLETSEQMRRCLKQLRALTSQEIENRTAWPEVLDSLREMSFRQGSSSSQIAAHQLCQHLRSVLVQLGKIE